MYVGGRIFAADDDMSSDTCMSRRGSSLIPLSKSDFSSPGFLTALTLVEIGQPNRPAHAKPMQNPDANAMALNILLSARDGLATISHQPKIRIRSRNTMQRVHRKCSPRRQIRGKPPGCTRTPSMKFLASEREESAWQRLHLLFTCSFRIL
nr:hypothetical protein CFP56_64832 [Quercus suber]